MSLNWKQFHAGIVVPTLLEWPEVPHSLVEDRLVSETLWHESDQLTCLGQVPNDDDPDYFGPGLGICSMERDTWDDLVGRRGCPFRKRQYSELIYDLRLNVIACRYRYFIDLAPLPRLDDGIKARATYWWKVYNRGQVDRRADYIRNAKAIPWEAA